jgi:hypothetical protein
MDHLGWALRTFVPLSMYSFLPTRRVEELQDRPVVIIGCDTGMGNALILKLVNQLKMRRIYAGCFTEEGEKSVQKSTNGQIHKTFRIDVRDVNSVQLASQFIANLEPNGVFAVANIAGAM